jgi:hypothetical protein
MGVLLWERDVAGRRTRRLRQAAIAIFMGVLLEGMKAGNRRRVRCAVIDTPP